MNPETDTSAEKQPELQEESQKDALTVEQLDELAGGGGGYQGGGGTGGPR